MKNQFIQIYILLLLIIGCKSDYTYFPHEQGLHWNYKIVFKSDYTGIEEKRDYQLQMHHYLLIKKESLFQNFIQMEI